MRFRVLVRLLLLAGLVLPAPAVACAPGRTTFVGGSSHVSPNGSLMLVFQCSYDCQPTLPEVNVRDGSATLVPGKTVRLKTLGHSLWVEWQPTEPFAADATYSAQADGAPWEFKTTSTVPDPEPVLTFQATLTSIGAGEQVCCERYPYKMYCHGESSCFQNQRQEAVLLNLKGDSGSTAFDYLYRITFRAGSETKVLPDQPRPQAAFISDTVASDYCYQVDAVRPGTGEVTHVSDGCQSLGVRSLEVRPPTDPELRANLTICAHAPAGYEADWKRLGFSGRPGDVQTPEATDAGEDASIDNDESDTADASPPATHSVTDSGCSITRGAQASHSLLVPLLAAALASLTRRSRGS